jgi:hypothetical protein
VNKLKIGKRIYYDITTGNVLVDTGQHSGFVTPTTIEQDISDYKALSERTRESFDVIELEFGQYAQDFRECNGYRINVETGSLEFSYPDSNVTEPQEPVYQKPLSEQVKKLEDRQDATQQAVDFLLMGGM